MKLEVAVVSERFGNADGRFDAMEKRMQVLEESVAKKSMRPPRSSTSGTTSGVRSCGSEEAWKPRLVQGMGALQGEP